MLGLTSKISFFLGTQQLGTGETIKVVGAAVFDHGPEDVGKLLGGGRCLGPGFEFQPPEPVAQR